MRSQPLTDGVAPRGNRAGSVVWRVDVLCPVRPAPLSGGCRFGFDPVPGGHRRLSPRPALPPHRRPLRAEHRGQSSVSRESDGDPTTAYAAAGGSRGSSAGSAGGRVSALRKLVQASRALLADSITSGTWSSSPLSAKSSTEATPAMARMTMMAVPSTDPYLPCHGSESGAQAASIRPFRSGPRHPRGMRRANVLGWAAVPGPGRAVVRSCPTHQPGILTDIVGAAAANSTVPSHLG